MIQTHSVEIAVVGGGMVGMATALGLAEAGYQVAVIERAEPQPVSGEPRLRVSAINRASQRWLESLGVWQRLDPARLAPYDAMAVWDKDSIGKIGFDAETLQEPDLGHIVENDALAYALWQQSLGQERIRRFIGTPERWAQGEREAWLTLDSGDMITARLLLAADGANSWLRQQAQIPLTFRDYGHHALVATIECQQPHQRVARQVFLPDGPLALLPLADPHRCSIVWSQPPALAAERAEMSPEAFGQALTVASEARLGALALVSQRAVFPLTMRYAQDFVRPRLALLGDAAHTIHPLAGQGVNLGLGDGLKLVETLSAVRGSEWDIGDVRLLQRYGRARKAAAQEMLAAMEGLRWLFAGSHPLKKGLRDLGLNLVDQAGPVKNQLLKKALGLGGR